MMKKTAAMMLAMALIAAFAGCAPQNTPAPSPSPAAVATPAASPVVSPEVTNNAGTGPNTQGNTDGVIEGFKEGEVVDADKLPDKVKTAIKEKYPEATIKTVTFATYENQQLYKILLQKTESDTTEEVYVTANGAITPAKATAAATPGVSPAAYFCAKLGRIAKIHQKKHRRRAISHILWYNKQKRTGRSVICTDITATTRCSLR